MLRRFTMRMIGYCVFFIRLSRRERKTDYYFLHSYGRSRRRGKKQRSPFLSTSFYHPKKALFIPLLFLSVFFCQKNEKKCRQKSVEEFVNETRTKKHAHQIGDGDDDERTKERGSSSSRAWSSRLRFFFFCFFFRARAG